MTAIFKRTVLPQHQTAAAVWCWGILAVLCLFLIPLFVTAITLAEELNSLEQQMVILEAEIARSEQGVPGSLSKQELLRQYQTLQTRIQTATDQIQGAAGNVTVPADSVPLPPSIAVISPAQDQRIEGKADTSFTIQWRTENWGEGALANIEMIRQLDGVTVLARSGVPSPNNITNTTSVNIRTNATTAKTYKVRVFAANNPSVFAESGWFVIAPPPSDQAITLSSCGEITKSGKYILDRNISSTQDVCLNVHDTQNVYIDCVNHRIAAGNVAVYLSKIKDFSLRFCESGAISVARSAEGEITNNKINSDTLALLVNDSSNLKISHNNFKGFYQQNYTTGSRIEGNTFDLLNLSGGVISSNGAIVLTNGENNTVIANTINGRAKGDFSSQIGADDGIILDTEAHDIVNGNTAANVWDCGIETVGLISDTTISNNSINNAGLCGIGGWYWSSWMGNFVKNNVVANTPLLFSFFRSYGIRPQNTDQYTGHVQLADGPVYFKDNIFEKNKLIVSAPKQGYTASYSSRITMMESVSVSQSAGERQLRDTDFILGNNVFKDNDFTTVLEAPFFKPFSMIIDGGGNICGKIPSENYPLKCGQITFTTPLITVLTPNGGEPWIFGEKQKISWVKNGTIPPQAVIAAYIYKGDQVSALPYSGYAKDDKRTGDMPPNSGYFEWTVPLNSSVPFIRQGGGDYRIKVVMAVDGKIIARDVSNSPFTISASSAGGGGGQHVATPPNQLPTTVLYPNGGENITQGQLAVIQWTSELPDTFNYNLTLLDARGETVIREIDSNRPKGKYAWYVPSDIPPGQYRVRISGAGALSSDTSNSAFTIVARQIAVSQVTSPRSNQPPVVKSITGPTSVVAGSQNTWTITATDPDGQSVSVSAYSIGADLISGDLFAKSSATKGTEQSFSWSFIFREAGTYPLIVTAKDIEGAVSASTQFLVSAMPSEIKVSIANSPTAPAGVVFPGTEKTLGAFDMTVTGEPVSVDRVAILVEGGSALVHDLYLYDENGVKFEQRVDDTRGPAFPRPKIVFPVGTHTYTVKGTVEATTPFGTAVGIGVHPGSWHNAVGTITGRPATIPTQIILLSIMTVKTPSLGFSASRAGTVRSPTVSPGTKEVPITVYKLDGSALEEDARMSSISLSYDDYGSNGSGAPQLEACRLNAGGEQITSGANIVAPPVGPFGSVTSVDVSFSFDAHLVVSKGTIKELTLICDVASAAVGRFSFGVGAGAVSAVGVSSGAPVAVSKGISARGAIFTVSSATSFIGSDSLLASILAALRSLFPQQD